MAMTGCPSEFGKDGRVAKAVRKDAHPEVRDEEARPFVNES
jgi:hypothetical protein